MGEIDELHSIAITIMQDPTINVVIDNNLPTACTDYETIYITDQLIPPELQKYKRVKSRMYDGQVAHEAGHIVVTKPYKEALTKWVSQKPRQRLGEIVHQVLADVMDNHYILQRFRYDYAHRLQLLADITNRSWVDTLKSKVTVRMGNNLLSNPTKSETDETEQILIPLSMLKGLWNYPVEKEFKLTDEQKTFLQQVAKICDDAKYDRMLMSILRRYQQLYNIFEERIEKTEQRPEDGTPKAQGGDLAIHSGEGTRKAIAKMEKQLKKAEEKAEEEAKKENRRRKDDDEQMAAGAGNGLSIPTPVPNEDEYELLASRNRRHIERLLNLLKRLSRPVLVTEKWRQQGRFMTEILGKAVASSTNREITGLHSVRTVKIEKAEVCMGLLVDLSGSVDEMEAKDSLTTIAEVCGRWLRDEDFAIMVFGSDYQKIKAYVEPYHTTRHRIGGVTCLGGTELYKPLEELWKMMKSQHNSRDKILMIVSDFCVSKERECKNLIRRIERSGIKVVGLGIDSTTIAQIKEYCKLARYIGNIKELPEAVFDLYRERAF